MAFMVSATTASHEMTRKREDIRQDQWSNRKTRFQPPVNSHMTDTSQQSNIAARGTSWDVCNAQGCVCEVYDQSSPPTKLNCLAQGRNGECHDELGARLRRRLYVHCGEQNRFAVSVYLHEGSVPAIEDISLMNKNLPKLHLKAFRDNCGFGHLSKQGKGGRVGNMKRLHFIRG